MSNIKVFCKSCKKEIIYNDVEKYWEHVPVNGSIPRHIPVVPDFAALNEPAPQGDGVLILPLVMADIQARADMGQKKYGTKLKANNGRDVLMDAYQEAIDLVMYLRQAIAERDINES